MPATPTLYVPASGRKGESTEAGWIVWQRLFGSVESGFVEDGIRRNSRSRGLTRVGMEETRCCGRVRGISLDQL